MAHENCESQIAVLEMNGQSVPQRWTSMREGSNTARRQCGAWNVELSAIHRAKILASRESGCRVAHSRQVVRCHPMETLEHLDADSETDAISDIQPWLSEEEPSSLPFQTSRNCVHYVSTFHLGICTTSLGPSFGQ